MTPYQKRKYYKEYEREYNRAEIYAYNRFKTVLSNQLKEVIANIKAKGIIATEADISNIITDTTLRTAFIDVYVKIGDQFKAFLTPRLPKQKNATLGTPSEVFGIGFFSDSFVRQMQEYATTIAGAHITSITETTRKQVKEVLSEAAGQNLSIPNTAKLMRQRLGGQFNKNRSLLIARTETTTAANYSQFLTAQNAGIRLKKEWLVRLDGRERSWHGAMNDVVVGLDEDFTVNGAKMKYPGDSRGGAANLCNCFLPDQLTFTDKSSIKKVFRAMYNGEVVTIHTSAKKSFTCTPNHPILTNNGWVAAKELTNSHKLVKSEFIEMVSGRNFNINNIPSTFEQIFNSVEGEGDIVRMRGSNVNFYGDIPASDVDIVTHKSELPYGFKMGIYNSLKGHIFKCTNFYKRLLSMYSLFGGSTSKMLLWKFSHDLVGLLSQRFKLLLSHFAKPSLVGLASIPNLNVMLFKDASNNISAAPIKIGQRKFTRRVVVFINNVFFVNFKSPFNTSRSGGAARDIIFNKDFVSAGYANADNIGGILDAFSREVKLDDVIGVNISHYKGFVYTFETYTQMYNINGSIARNCRCTVAYIPDEMEVVTQTTTASQASIYSPLLAEALVELLAGE